MGPDRAQWALQGGRCGPYRKGTLGPYGARWDQMGPYIGPYTGPYKWSYFGPDFPFAGCPMFPFWAAMFSLCGLPYSTLSPSLLRDCFDTGASVAASW